MFYQSRPTFRVAARALAVGVALVVAVAACGSPSPTPPRSESPTPGVAITPTGAPAPTETSASTGTPAPALQAIYPVPTSQPDPPAAAPVAVLDSQMAANLQAALNAVRASGRLAGISAAVVFPDGSMWTGQSGSAILPKTPVTATTLFSVGSISKTFVAALALRLAEQGKISLNDPLSKYVPTFPNASHITLSELLDHRSGIRDVFDSTSMANAITGSPSKMWTVAQVLARIGVPYFAPGRGYHYSNTNYILLGVVIEKVTGKTIASLVRSEFLDPLGMKNTWFQPEEKAPIADFAHGYMNSPSKPRDVSKGQTMLPYNSEATVAWTSGGFVSTASDLARWASALYGGGVLDESELAWMTDVSPTLPYTANPYGYGFEVATIDKQMVWGHRGHLDGFWSAMWYLPDDGITLVILTNDEWTVTQTVDARMVQTLLAG